MFSAEIPAAETSTSLRTRVGNASASSAPMKPPIELPTTTGFSISSASHSASITRAKPWIEIRPAGISERPEARQVGRDHAEAIHERRDVEQPVLPQPAEPVQEQQRRAVAAGVDHVDAAAEDELLARERRPVDRHPRRVVAVGVRRVRLRRAANALAGSARTCPMNPDTPLPYQRPCASRSTSTRRCTRTGTSWPRSPGAASGSTCPTTRSTRGRSTALEPEQLQGVRGRDPPRRARARRRAVPGRGRDDPRAGTSTATSSTSRATAPPTRTPHTSEWLDQIGLPHDELYCSYDKIARCVEIEIDVLIDDSPVNLARAVEVGITAATLEHPWNRDVCRGRHQRPRLADARAHRPGAAPRMNDEPSPAPRPPDHRAYLPAIEPERQVTDWGRSERVESRLRQDALRVPLPLLVPGRGRGHRARPGHRRRAAGLQPRRRAAARRGDDRQGDQDRARPAAAAASDRRALLQGLSGPDACWSPSSAASPRTRPTCTACCYDEEQLVLVFPEGRKGTEKLYKDRYRLRRFGRGGFVESAMRAKAPIVPVAVVGAEEAMPVFAQLNLAQEAHRPDLLPDHADVPAARPARRRSATCRPSSSSASWSRSRPTSGATSRGTTRASCRRSPRRSAPGSRRSSTRCSPPAARSGSVTEPPRPDHRPLQLLGRPARAGARARRRASR